MNVLLPEPVTPMTAMSMSSFNGWIRVDIVDWNAAQIALQGSLLLKLEQGQYRQTIIPSYPEPQRSYEG